MKKIIYLSLLVSLLSFSSEFVTKLDLEMNKNKEISVKHLSKLELLSEKTKLFFEYDSFEERLKGSFAYKEEYEKIDAESKLELNFKKMNLTTLSPQLNFKYDEDNTKWEFNNEAKILIYSENEKKYEYSGLSLSHELKNEYQINEKTKILSKLKAIHTYSSVNVLGSEFETKLEHFIDANKTFNFGLEMNAVKVLKEDIPLDVLLKLKTGYKQKINLTDKFSVSSNIDSSLMLGNNSISIFGGEIIPKLESEYKINDNFSLINELLASYTYDYVDTEIKSDKDNEVQKLKDLIIENRYFKLNTTLKYTW